METGALGLAFVELPVPVGVCAFAIGGPHERTAIVKRPGTTWRTFIFSFLLPSEGVPVYPAARNSLHYVRHFNSSRISLDERFTAKGWTRQPSVFDEPEDPGAKMDFLKERIGIEVRFGHSSFLGIDLLKFQVASYSGLNKIDAGIYISTTADFQKRMRNEFGQNWEGSLTFEKISRYLPPFKSAIQVPILVIGIEF